jgi:hypothetical protein
MYSSCLRLCGSVLRAFGTWGLFVLPILGTLLMIALLPLLTTRSILIPGVLLVFGTPVLWYTIVFWEHTLAAGLALAAFILAERERPILAGVLAAVSTAFREEGYVLIASIVVAVILTRNEVKRKDLSGGDPSPSKPALSERSDRMGAQDDERFPTAARRAPTVVAVQLTLFAIRSACMHGGFLDRAGSKLAASPFLRVSPNRIVCGDCDSDSRDSVPRIFRAPRLVLGSNSDVVPVTDADAGRRTAGLFWRSRFRRYICRGASSFRMVAADGNHLTTLIVNQADFGVWGPRHIFGCIR